MKGVTNEVIAAVRSRANILEVVSDTVVLKRVGKDYKGLCPFHKEKTPSFYVNPEKGIYKCFGCGEGGDVFAFIQKAKGFDFIEGVKQLAEQFGVALTETEEERIEYKKRGLFMLLYEQSCEFYGKLLKDPAQGAVAQQYLANRGIDESIIQKFRLGYAPQSWDALINYLCQKNKVSLSTLEEAGLVRRRMEGTGHFDLFRHRLIIPIADEQGRVIAFGGRTLGDDQVKYLNSPETPIYKKGEHLFALGLAKESIKTKDAVIVVEGYFDAITAHMCGFTNTVATLGTALSNEQGKLLVRHTESKRVYLAFDADSAGMKATEKGAETLQELASGIGIDLRVIKITNGKDPDECLRSTDGTARFSQSLENSQPLTEYEIDQAIASCDRKTRDGRIEAARRIVPIIARMKNAVARSEYIRQLAGKLDVQEESLLADVSRERKFAKHTDSRPNGQEKGAAQPVSALKSARTRPADGLIEAERWLLASFLSDKTDYDLVTQSLIKEELMTTSHAKIIKAIYEIGNNFNDIAELEGKLLNYFASDPQTSSALVEILFRVEDIRKQKMSVPLLLLQSRVRLMRERIVTLTRRIRDRLFSSSDSSDSNHLQSKISELNRLERLTLPTLKTMTEIDALTNQIKEISLSLEFQPLMENTFESEKR